MRVRTLLAAAVLAAVGASTANAAITINQQVVPGTGDLAGFQINRFFAKLGAEEIAAGATGLQSIDMSIDTIDNLKIKFTPINTHSGNDADVYGQTQLQDDTASFNPATATSDVGTFIRGVSFIPDIDPGTPGNQGAAEDMSGWNPVTLEPGAVGRNLTSAANPASAVLNTYGNTKHLRVAGATLAPNEPDVRATSDQGALFALVVVPVGITPRGTFTASLAGERGAITTITGEVLAVPEPGSFAILGMGAACLLGRRRRA